MTSRLTKQSYIEIRDKGSAATNDFSPKNKRRGLASLTRWEILIRTTMTKGKRE